MVRFSFIMTFFLCLTGISQAQNKIKWESWDVVNDKIAKGNKKFIVYFYFDGCKWCRYMEETTLRNDQTAKFINNNFYSFKVNALSTNKIVINNQAYTTMRIGKYDFHELAANMLGGDMSFPAIAFLDEDFNKISVEGGYAGQENFEMILSYYAGNHYKKTLFKRYANNYCRESHFNALVNQKN